MLWVALATVGSIAVLFVSHTFRDSVLDQQRKQLLDLSYVGATVVDLRAQTTLRKPEDVKRPEYAAAVRPLRQLRNQLDDIRFIYTLWFDGTNLRFVLDSAEAGDNDHDGVEDRSLPGESYPDATPTLLHVASTGIAAVERNVTSDRWGATLSAYAPIKSPDGKTVGVLGIDRDASDIQRAYEWVDRTRSAALVVVLALAGFMSMLIGNAVVRGRSEYNLILRYARTWRGGILVFLTGLLAFSVLGMGVFGSEALKSQLRAAHQGLRELAALEEVRGILQSCAGLSGDALHGCVVTTSFRSDWNARDRVHKLEEEMGPAATREQLLEALANQRVKLIRRDWRFQAADESARRVEIGLSLAVVLSFVCLLLIQAALRQESDLRVARYGEEKALGAYLQIAENLPIGFFTYRDGEIVSANRRWELQLGERAEPTAWSRFEASLKPEAFSAVKEVLERAEREQASIEHSFEVEVAGRPHTLEIRGVPVVDDVGEVEHILAFSVDVTRRVHAQQEAEELNVRLLEALQQLEQTLGSTVMAFVRMVEAKDPYTAGHSERVMQYSVMIGRALGLSGDDLRVLEMGSLIHDVGKIGVPDRILQKRGPLTPEERMEIQRHAELGAEMVHGIAGFAQCVPIVRWHHERLNGSGYPDGLVGEEIPLMVRVVAVADVFDALTSNRSYRAALEPAKAIAMLREDATNGILDIEIVEVLAEAIAKRSGMFISAKAA